MSLTDLWPFFHHGPAQSTAHKKVFCKGCVSHHLLQASPNFEILGELGPTASFQTGQKCFNAGLSNFTVKYLPTRLVQTLRESTKDLELQKRQLMQQVHKSTATLLKIKVSVYMCWSTAGRDGIPSGWSGLAMSGPLCYELVESRGCRFCLIMFDIIWVRISFVLE